MQGGLGHLRGLLQHLLGVAGRLLGVLGSIIQHLQTKRCFKLWLALTVAVSCTSGTVQQKCLGGEDDMSSTAPPPPPLSLLPTSPRP